MLFTLEKDSFYTPLLRPSLRNSENFLRKKFCIKVCISKVSGPLVPCLALLHRIPIGIKVSFIFDAVDGDFTANIAVSSCSVVLFRVTQSRLYFQASAASFRFFIFFARLLSWEAPLIRISDGNVSLSVFCSVAALFLFSAFGSSSSFDLCWTGCALWPPPSLTAGFIHSCFHQH